MNSSSTEWEVIDLFTNWLLINYKKLNKLTLLINIVKIVGLLKKHSQSRILYKINKKIKLVMVFYNRLIIKS